MTVQIVDINECKKNLVAEVPAETVEKEVDQLAREYVGKAKVPGFRPGKVPLAIVKQRYSNDLWQEATEDIIRRSWKAALAHRRRWDHGSPRASGRTARSAQPRPAGCS